MSKITEQQKIYIDSLCSEASREFYSNDELSMAKHGFRAGWNVRGEFPVTEKDLIAELTLKVEYRDEQIVKLKEALISIAALHLSWSELEQLNEYRNIVLTDTEIARNALKEFE